MFGLERVYVCATQPLHCRPCRHLERVYKKSESKWCWDFGVREVKHIYGTGSILSVDGTGATSRLVRCKGSPMLSPTMCYYVRVEDWA